MGRHLYLVDGSMDFSDLVALKPENFFYEMEYGFILKSIVIDDPVVLTTDDGYEQVSFNTKTYDFDKETLSWIERSENVSYLATKNLMAYGGKFYRDFSVWDYEKQNTVDI